MCEKMRVVHVVEGVSSNFQRSAISPPEVLAGTGSACLGDPPPQRRSTAGGGGRCATLVTILVVRCGDASL